MKHSVIEKLMVAEPDGSVPKSQDPPSGFYPEPDESGPRAHKLYL
jgi:hypothetical protein